MNNKVLVITDNKYLCAKFYEIICEPKYDSFDFTFAISPFSESFQFLPIKAIVINLKNINDVNYIIKNFDIVFSIHCKQIFPDKLIESVKCINIHPGYNPINRGWYPQVFSIIYNIPIGATIHEIDKELDHGKVIVREYVQKTNFDTSLSLYNKIIEKEIELLNCWLLRILQGKYKSFPPENEGLLFLKKDFNNMCKINLDEIATYKQCIDKLRALTHGDFRNCYFIDEDTGLKIYIKLSLEVEN